MTRDLHAAQKTLQKLTMKPLSLKDHDIAIDTLIASQAAAAEAVNKRQTAAQKVVASFTASPSEGALAQAVNAQGELDALAKIAEALPAAEHRERWLRDEYVTLHRDALFTLLSADLEDRLKPRPQWKRAVAAKIARLSERLAMREEGALDLARASAEADALDNSIAGASAAESAARRALSVLTNSPSFAALTDARATVGMLTF